MDHHEQNQRLIAVVDKLLGRKSQRGLGPLEPPFDVSRPTIHENKSDFKMEIKAVGEALAHIDDAIGNLIGPRKFEEVRRREMFARLGAAVNQTARSKWVGKYPSNMRDMIRKNCVDSGLLMSSMLAMDDLRVELQKRLEELETQRKIYWSDKNRPPDHFARIIALRLASLYVSSKREMPTFGTSSQGNHPSTDYGRALENVFEILGIKVGFRGPGKWAIEQVSTKTVVSSASPFVDFLSGDDGKVS